MIPQQIYEHLLAWHYGWSLEDIRAMSNYDFKAHIHICMMRDVVEKDFKAILAGAKPSKGGSVGNKISPTSSRSGVQHKKFDPIVGDFV